MRKIVIIVLNLTFCLFSQAQTSWKKSTQHFSPNASLLGTYGQVPVNYFNGMAQIAIPLTTFKVNGYDLPITLSYYSSGNKPDSHPGWVGLGWNLVAGGAINRIVNGLKDETTTSEWNYLHGFPPQYDALGFYYRGDSLNRSDWDEKNYMGYILKEKWRIESLCGWGSYPYDTEPDEFQVNLGDISASFYLTYNNTVRIKSKSNSNFKININMGTENGYELFGQNPPLDIGLTANCFTYIKEIILTNNDGVKYYFGGYNTAIEFSFKVDKNDNLLGIANTWHLKKIELPNGEIILFNYEKDGLPIIEHNNKYFTQVYVTDDFIQEENSNFTQYGKYSYTLIQPSYLKSIQSINSGRTMTFKRSQSTELGYNIDADNFRHVFQWNDQAKIYTYDYVSDFSARDYYMQLDSIIDNDRKIGFIYNDSIDSRLKLRSITFNSNQNSVINRYLFEYNPTKLPNYNSKKTDNWGYYNNRSYEDEPYQNLYGYRKADTTTYAKAEILTKITYPTGGTTEFIYEPHYFSRVAKQFPFELIDSTSFCGGLRIKRIINNDMNNHNVIREFEYKNKNGASSGILSGVPIIYSGNGTKNFNLEYSVGNSLSKITEDNNYDYNYGFGNQQIQNQMGNTNGSHITYGRVTEKLSDGSKTIYNYSNHDNFPDMGPEATAGNLTDVELPCNKFNSFEIERGLLDSIEYYKYTTLIKKEIFTYNSNPNRYSEFVKSINIYSFYGMVRAVPIKIFTFYPYLKSKTETIYDKDGNNAVSVTSNYRYNSYKLPYLESRSGSKSPADSVAVVIKYPFDNNGLTYSAMTKRFMLNYPIETKKYKGTYITEGKLSTYKPVIFNSDTLFLPDKVFSSEISSPITSFPDFNGTTIDSHYGLSPDIEFDKYDAKGNILQLHNRNDINVSYIWGYNQTYPIAIALDVNVDEIAYTGFETTKEDLGSWIFLGTNIGTTDYYGVKPGDKYLLNLSQGIKKSGLNPQKNYKISFWYKWDDIYINDVNVADITAGDQTWHFYTGIMTPDQNGEIKISGPGNIDELILRPDNSQMSTYAYKPFIGMTSQTDPNGKTTYYEYDSFGRLQYVKDDQGKILKKYDYHYSNQ